jgi:hypothetical protein
LTWPNHGWRFNPVEAQGAQNMIVKQEEFETPEGVKGLKAYGTLN